MSKKKKGVSAQTACQVIPLWSGTTVSRKSGGADVPWWEDEEIVSKSGKGGKGYSYTPCHATHPALKIGEFTVWGSSCKTPVVKDADVYIGFDGSMQKTSRRFPWTPGHEVYFPITDMHAPDDPELFKQLITWTVDQLHAGHKVHAGCIGGHGRTGLFLAALYAHMTGEADAIAHVRKHYCEKAVETKKQVDFLVKHFGVKEADPIKFSYSGKSYSGKTSLRSGPRGLPKDAVPVKSPMSIWG